MEKWLTRFVFFWALVVTPLWVLEQIRYEYFHITWWIEWCEGDAKRWIRCHGTLQNQLRTFQIKDFTQDMPEGWDPPEFSYIRGINETNKKLFPELYKEK